MSLSLHEINQEFQETKKENRVGALYDTYYIAIQRNFIVASLLYATYIAYTSYESSYAIWGGVYTALLGYFLLIQSVKIDMGDGARTLKYSMVAGLLIGAGMILLALADEHGDKRTQLMAGGFTSLLLALAFLLYLRQDNHKTIHHAKYGGEAEAGAVGGGGGG